jgi:F420-0:gamma-glutamyl ligase-like protein
MAGYSGKPITEKLGLKPGHRVYVEKTPEDLRLEWPDSVTVLRRSPARPVDIVWAFGVERRRLERRMPALVTMTAVAGSLWISWPKKASGVRTDLDENVVRQLGLDAGVVDVKVAAVDDTWSALKFVRRLKDR